MYSSLSGMGDPEWSPIPVSTSGVSPVPVYCPWDWRVTPGRVGMVPVTPGLRLTVGCHHSGLSTTIRAVRNMGIACKELSWRSK
jgi:hypothetical protein